MRRALCLMATMATVGVMSQPLIVNNDGFSYFYTGTLSDAASLRDYALSFRGTNVEILEWCVGSSRVNYPSQFTELIGHKVEQAPRRGDRRAADMYRDLYVGGVDSLRVVADACREAGIKCYASLRANPYYGAGWAAEYFNADFWRNNPQLRVRGQDGQDRVKLSYAFPETRAFHLALIMEMLQRGVDGIQIDFLRHPPFVGWEKPVADDFQRLHAEDVTKVGGDDERLQRLWCSYVSDFLRQVRAITQAASAQQGKPIGVAVRIDDQHTGDWGLDPATWCKEGLVDIVCVGRHSLGGYALDIAPFAQMAQGTKVRIFASEEHITGGHDTTPAEDKAAAQGKPVPQERSHLSHEDYETRAERWTAQGAVGVHVFNNPSDWELFATLGGR